MSSAPIPYNPSTTTVYVRDCIPEERSGPDRNPSWSTIIFLDSGFPLCSSNEYPHPENPLILPVNPTISTTTVYVPSCIQDIIKIR